MLNKIKLLLGITGADKDEILKLLIEIVTDEVKNFCNIDSIEGMESTVMQMVVIKYNTMGHEGLASENYSGVSYTYLADYPESVLSVLRKHRRLKVL